MPSESQSLLRVAQAEGGSAYAKQYEGQPAFPRIGNLMGAGVWWPMPRGAQRRGRLAGFDLLTLGGEYPDCWNGETHPGRMDLVREVAERVRGESPDAPLLARVDATRVPEAMAAAVRDDWWIRNRDGRRVLAEAHDRYLANVTHPGWHEHLSAFIRRHVVEVGLFDGLLLEGTCPRFPTPLPTQSDLHLDLDGDGRWDTWQELNRMWADGVSSLLEAVRSVLPTGMLLVGEELAQRDAAHVNGTLLPDALDSCYRQPTVWRDILSEYLAWSRLGRQPRMTILSVGSGVHPGRPPQPGSDRFERIVREARERVNRMRFGLCTALLGDGTYAYDVHRTARGQSFRFDDYDAPLGYPLADASPLQTDIWTRPFQGGQVLVNAGAKPVTVCLDGPCRAVGGPVETTAVELRPQEGYVLVPSGDR